MEKGYVKSRFNVMSRTDHGELILYNSYTGAIVSFGREEEPAVMQALGGAGTAESLNELEVSLVEHGFLVPASADEFRRAQFLHQSQHRTDLLHLYVLTTEQCNFRCTYCYEDFQRGGMTEDAREGLKRFVANKAPALQQMSISWYGGEPLLGLEAIQELSESFLATAEAHGVAYDADIATNGFLLTEPVFRKLLSWNIKQFMITLDGPAEVHDARRGLKNGGGSFHRVVENLLAMKATDEEFKVSVRVNFDNSNLETIPSLIPLLAEWFGGDPRFQTYFRPVTCLGGENDSNLPVCDQSTKNVKIWEFTRMGLEQGLGISTLIEGMLMPSASVCTTARPYSLVVASDGSLFKCAVALDKEEMNRLGRIHRDGTAEIDADKLAFWVTSGEETDETCQSCFYRPACQGNFCPNYRLQTGERPCSNEKHQIKKVLNLVHRHHEMLSGH